MHLYISTTLLVLQYYVGDITLGAPEFLFSGVYEMMGCHYSGFGSPSEQGSIWTNSVEHDSAKIETD